MAPAFISQHNTPCAKTSVTPASAEGRAQVRFSIYHAVECLRHKRSRPTGGNVSIILYVWSGREVLTTVAAAACSKSLIYYSYLFHFMKRYTTERGQLQTANGCVHTLSHLRCLYRYLARRLHLSAHEGKNRSIPVTNKRRHAL